MLIYNVSLMEPRFSCRRRCGRSARESWAPPFQEVGVSKGTCFLPLVKPRVSIFSTSQIVPGSCGGWSHRMHVCETDMEVVRLLCLMGKRSSSCGVLWRPKSANVDGFHFFLEGLSGAGSGGNGRDPGRIPRLDWHCDNRVAQLPGSCVFARMGPGTGQLWIGLYESMVSPGCGCRGLGDALPVKFLLLSAMMYGAPVVVLL